MLGREKNSYVNEYFDTIKLPTFGKLSHETRLYLDWKNDKYF